MSKGFTLIESLVTLSVLAVVLVTAGTVLINSLQSSTRADTTSQLDNAADWTMGEIKKNILSSSSSGITCPVSGATADRIVFINSADNQPTTLQCVDYTGDLTTTMIASISANLPNTFRLSARTIKVSNCSQFVSCDFDASGVPTAVNIKFTLSLGDLNTVDKGYSRDYVQKITLRQ